MPIKNKSGELVGLRTPAQSKRDIEFKKLAVQQIDASGENWSHHALALMKRDALSRILYLNELYQTIIDVPGVICEFGVHWGASISTLLNLRNIYEPYNGERFIYGFDTFEGFDGVSDEDGDIAAIGDYKSVPDFDRQLGEILGYHESISAFPNRKMFELLKGDANISIDLWLKDNPGATIALAIFDMDIYLPTKGVLEKILPRLTKNSVLVFDDFCHRQFPGEVQAVREVLSLQDVDIQKSKFQSHVAIVRF